VVGKNENALQKEETFPNKKIDRIQCCRLLKTEALKHTLDGTLPRYKLNINSGRYELDQSKEPYTGVIVGVRSDEEGSRSKERYFSSRDKESEWDIGDQPPELWDQYKTDFAPGTHVRIHPLLDWTELNIWEYILRENISTVSLYYDCGEGKRYRSIGCWPCTSPVASSAKNAEDIVKELKSGRFAKVAERDGRAQDKDDDGGLETLRREGYM
jgi:sulfate adenylyltransferase subunit 2